MLPGLGLCPNTNKAQVRVKQVKTVAVRCDNVSAVPRQRSVQGSQSSESGSEGGVAEDFLLEGDS